MCKGGRCARGAAFGVRDSAFVGGRGAVKRRQASRHAASGHQAKAHQAFRAKPDGTGTGD